MDRLAAMTIYAQGCDYAFAPYPSAAELKAAGMSFVCRYLSGGPADGKDITKSELTGYLGGGINVVLNWETGGTMDSEAQGISDATSANAEAASLGEPDAPIIFSADFDPDTSSLIANIVAYMTGVQSVLGKARTGIYGGVAAINAVAEAGIGTYFWQTSAWSSGQVSSYAQLYQYGYSGSVSGISVDLDEALAEDYGYIGGSSPTPPPPPPPPAPATHWTTSPLVEDGDTGVLVDTVQYLLNQSGDSLTVDGNFGALTLAAVKAFQTAHSIEPAGEVHGYTWPALVVLVQDGSTGDAVKAAQTLLNSADNAGLTVDGDDGANTTAAVETFQTKAKVTVDGIVGDTTWNALVNAA